MALFGFLLSAVFFGISVALMVRLRARAAECIEALRCATESEEARQAATRETERLRAELNSLRNAKTAATGTPPLTVVESIPVPTAATVATPETPRLPRAATTRRAAAAPAALILVAGGSAASRATSLDRLRENGYDVREAESPSRLIPSATEEKPALILLDLASDAAGWKTLTDLKAASALHDTPVVVVCAAKDRERAMEAGAAGCVAEGDSVFLSTIKATLTEQKRRAERSRLANRMQNAA